MLPKVKTVKLPSLTLPTAWQTVIFRNYGYVRCERIARVLGCDEETVRKEARRLGIFDCGYAENFESHGYITIIRNNWYLLPYDQLLQLLDFDEARLDFVLERDDFLSVKLGGFKPDCAPVFYAPLTEEQAEETAQIAARIARYSEEAAVAPFDFFSETNGEVEKEIVADGKRIVHGYLSPCGDVFATDCEDTIPDELLARYRAVGVNGIWLHGLLSTLSPDPFMPDLSEGYETRRRNLNRLITRCAKYGISVYLYMNEPRALPAAVRERYQDVVGSVKTGTVCMEKQAARDYLYGAVRGLCESCPDLGGIFTITMSENATHCNYAKTTDCPICRNVAPEKSASDVNNIMARAMRDSGCRGELIANLWGWSPFMGWDEQQIRRGVELLSPDIAVCCVSEYDLEIEKGGVKSRIIDYSIANPGPSEITAMTIALARETGHKVYSKIQASNSWECSAVPYIPVFDLVHEHLENLRGCGVRDHFLTWTLGGYPSPAVAITSQYGEGFDLDGWYRETFGADADAVHRGVLALCEAFREYPFSIKVLYNSPKNIGPANLWELEPEEKQSTMVCYAYDDMETWMKPYPYEVYVAQWEKLLSGWEEGLAVLERIPKNPQISEVLRYAKVCYCHFLTDLLQTRFANAKRENDTEEMRRCVAREEKNAETLLGLMKEDAKIGFEASNHYSYTERNLLEKILRMERFENSLKDKESENDEKNGI